MIPTCSCNKNPGCFCLAQAIFACVFLYVLESSREDKLVFSRLYIINIVYTGLPAPHQLYMDWGLEALNWLEVNAV